MAEYRNRYEEIRKAGADVAALSVDSPETSAKLRSELRLPFPILSDPERRAQEGRRQKGLRGLVPSLARSARQGPHLGAVRRPACSLSMAMYP